MKHLYLINFYLIILCVLSYLWLPIYCEISGKSKKGKKYSKMDEAPSSEETQSEEKALSEEEALIEEEAEMHARNKERLYKLTAIPYVPPSTEGLVFVETFDTSNKNEDIFSRWVVSSDPKSNGQWTISTRTPDAFIGDVGLKMVENNKFYAISTLLHDKAMVNNKGKDFILSYEVKFEDKPVCGGSYLKLFDHTALKDPLDLSSFDAYTSYIILFGPDYCFETNTVRLIIKSLNPISNKWVDHHLTKTTEIPLDTDSHLYGFHLKPDNTYSVYLDNIVVASGSMLLDFEPPFTNEEFIDDITDTKPSDWEDDEYILDDHAKKPQDWDDDAPITILDPNAVKPSDWLDHEKPFISDPSAKQPETWDETNYGKWIPPQIKNPRCSNVSGCGVYMPPTIINPKHKGKWKRPVIKNPKYNGPWKPKIIKNKEYFLNENPHAVSDVTAIGIEVWSVHANVIFDNIILSRNISRAYEFIDNTWDIRKNIEIAINARENKIEKKKSQDTYDLPKTNTNHNTILYQLNSILNNTSKPILIASSGIIVIAAIILYLSRAPKRNKIHSYTPETEKQNTHESLSDSDESIKDSTTIEEPLKKEVQTTTRKRLPGVSSTETIE